MTDTLPGVGFGCVYNCPVPINDYFSETRELQRWEAYERIRQNIQASLDCTVGTMPVHVFLDNFVPVVPPDRKKEILSSRGAFRSLPSSGSTSSDVYQALITALNKSTKHKSRAPGLVFENTSMRSENPHQAGYMKPHICCFTAENLEHVRRLPLSSREDMGYAEFFIEVRPHTDLEHFVDPPSDSKRKEWAAHDIAVAFEDNRVQFRVERAFGQHIAYALEIQARQHRLWVLSIALCGSRARFFRWDRSGFIVSRSFDVREEPEILCEFIARFACASDKERGHDQSVEMATAEEEATFQDVVSRYVEDQLGVTGDDLADAVKEHYQEGRVMAMQVFVNTSGGSSTDVVVERYLVSRPVTSPSTLGSRATRGYWAVQASTKRLVFLKDTWRLDLESEGDAIATLHGAGVRNVPLLVAHGDVYHRLPTPGEARSRLLIQSTQTEMFDITSWASRVADRKISTSNYIHYRLVLGTVGYGLKSFRGTDELLHATYDVFHAMRDALDKDSRLHRDLSVGNVILVKEAGSATRKGYLIDWEASSRINSEGHSLDKSRMGTWRFMSSDVQAKPAHPHAFPDDMESLLYVVFYCGLIHLGHNLSPGTLRMIVHEFFDRSFFLDGYLCGGINKGVNRVNRRMSSRIKWTNPDFQAWLDAVMDLHGPQGPENREKFEHLWAAPENLDNLWGEFLAEHTLARDDRVDNKLSTPEPPSNEAPGSDRPFVPLRPRSPSTTSFCEDHEPIAAPVPLGKRKRQQPLETNDLRVRRSDRLRSRTNSAALVAQARHDALRVIPPTRGDNKTSKPTRRPRTR
ncbi:uncharacterized protein TRAVEDRAFT_74824 [Trametes versicolor FP-101664 SS1]|uniref:uncharacterized protein n=1 Tax=Trametes versicolor (strain FP-101664) TaxID=717944 RepID=UPI0004623E16|nr:uncharacterized protein TRAVEDRAFT_74824 [Trametes versicolor FP-101664 SS1]EIW53537.1 hypothetical protein TRAVEDRAFT_74824 [Trametes versicolor FP-101664 SS1]